MISFARGHTSLESTAATSVNRTWIVTAENLMMTDEFFDIERIFFSQFVKDGSGWIEILANSSLFLTFPSLEVRVPRILKGFFFASMRFFRKKSDLSHSCLRIFVKHLEY